MPRHKMNRDNSTQPAPARPGQDNRAAQIVTQGDMAPDDPMKAYNEAPEMPSVDPMTYLSSGPGEPDNDAPEPPDVPLSQAPTDQGQPRVEPPPSDDDEIDDPRFKGKPPRELYTAYRNLESKLGEQGEEVRRYREYFDQTLRQTANPTATARPQEGEAENPEEDAKLVNEILTRPRAFIQRVQQNVLGTVAGVSAQATVAQIKQQNVDTLRDPNFATWLRSNVPQSLSVQADQDPGTLHFILNSYRAANPAQPGTAAPPPAASAAPVAPDRTATSQRVVAAAATPAHGKPRTDGKTYYSRQQLMALRLSDPAKYEAMQPEIMRAYDEGRIKP